MLTDDGHGLTDDETYNNDYDYDDNGDDDASFMLTDNGHGLTD